ncbi:cryptochrome/photolyase family protein [Neptunomonas marina]|uniref:Cryptochrome/photolyase family protein n=1 Tax=Neptunomonas marina TaxID=1815562 RepID=A0A437QEA5_9GAMM|nr:cryptochrome/photolyase family protein [Neptunomonas marina]RVU32854.1 cryptochrome/photolyase family protein [Neptunomonas marina]
MSTRTLRLILGDQLNASHSWYQQQDDKVSYLIAELPQEVGYVKHHVQKVCAFFAAMREFTAALQAAGHDVIYLTLDETQHHATLAELIADLCSQHKVATFQYQLPDERRLRDQLSRLSLEGVAISAAETEHFLLPEAEFPRFIKAGQHNRMDSFYRKMRKRLDILMEEGKPKGGQWSFDADNREPLRKDDLANVPEPLCFANDVTDILARLERHGVCTFGKAQAQLLWPINRRQAKALLAHFCTVCLPNFGRFQDAMTDQSPLGWSLYHSRLSFALNSKMLHPGQVIAAALAAYEADDAINIAQIEGFVRQIIGWREYVRAVYWVNSEQYDAQNFLLAERSLPEWFWDGDTKMRCLSQAITQSLDYAYAHHIQRLMVVGNFALIAGLSPDEVEAWYLGIYIDAIEWVEQPNTRSMALFADGGWVATKPYAASGNYINKMSDHCQSCHYNVKERSAPNACPFMSLYWHFLAQNKATLGTNPRMAFPYRTWDKMADTAKTETLARAQAYLHSLNEL